MNNIRGVYVIVGLRFWEKSSGISILHPVAVESLIFGGDT